MTKERQVICGMCGKQANLRHMRGCRRNVVKSIVEGRIHNLKIFNGEKTDFERRLLFTAIVIARFKLRLWYEKYRQWYAFRISSGPIITSVNVGELSVWLNLRHGNQNDPRFDVFSNFYQPKLTPTVWFVGMVEKSGNIAFLLRLDEQCVPWVIGAGNDRSDLEQASVVVVDDLMPTQNSQIAGDDHTCRNFCCCDNPKTKTWYFFDSKRKVALNLAIKQDLLLSVRGESRDGWAAEGTH